MKKEEPKKPIVDESSEKEKKDLREVDEKLKQFEKEAKKGMKAEANIPKQAANTKKDEKKVEEEKYEQEAFE